MSEYIMKNDLWQYSFEKYCMDNNILYENINDDTHRNFVETNWSDYTYRPYYKYKSIVYETLLSSFNSKKLYNEITNKFGKYIVQNWHEYLNDLANTKTIVLKYKDKSFIDNPDFIHLLNLYNYTLTYIDEDKNEKLIYLEPNVSDKMNDYVYNKCHGMVYHITWQSNIQNIKKYGLKPKTGRYRDFGNRVYFVSGENDCALFRNICSVENALSGKNNYDNLVVIPVKINKYCTIDDKNHISFFRDNAMNVDAIWTSEYIPPYIFGKILYIEDFKNDLMKNMYNIESVSKVECIGEFEDEYVYDIEMDDETHTFIANDILVHNSVYSQLDEVISTTDWCLGNDENWCLKIKYKNKNDLVHRYFCGKRTEEEVLEAFKNVLDDENVESYDVSRIPGEPKDFAIALDDAFLSGYFKKIFDEYAQKLNADNYLNFELETYSDAGIWLAKKKYMQNIRWTDSMPRHDILNNYSKIKSKGVELIQPSSPAFARTKLTYLVRWIFSHPTFVLKDFVEELRKIRDEFMVANPDEISWNKKATEYMKWIVDDNKELVMRKSTPITTKGIAYYNYKLNNNPQYKNRYSMLMPGNKCKYYYCKETLCEMFAYEPGMFPIEFAPEIDRKMMFNKTILTPINRIVEAIGFAPIEPDLIVLKSNKLF